MILVMARLRMWKHANIMLHISVPSYACYYGFESCIPVGSCKPSSCNHSPLVDVCVYKSYAW